MLKWGVVGLGNIANTFIEAIEELDDSQIVAVSSLTKKKSEHLLNKLGIEEKFFFTNYEDLLKCKEVDAVYIATLNNTHADLIIKSIKEKKNILCEKPFVLNFQEAEKIKKELDKNNIFFLEAFAYRLHPQTQALCKIIKENEIGSIKRVESSFGYKTRIKPESRLFNQKLGGGAILDVGCYPSSLSLLIAKTIEDNFNLNDLEINNISGNICKTGVDDIAQADLILNKKIIMRINTSITKNMINNCIIEGTNGKIVIPNPWSPNKKSFFEVYSGNRYYKKFIKSKYTLYANQIDLFSKSIKNKELRLQDTMMTINESLINISILDQWSKKLLNL